MVTRDKLIAWATSRGWKLDRHGHLQAEAFDGQRRYRLKLSRIAVESSCGRAEEQPATMPRLLPDLVPVTEVPAGN